MDNNVNDANSQREQISSKINKIIISFFVIFVVLVGSMLFNYYSTQQIIQNISVHEENMVIPKPAQKIVAPKVIYNLTGTIEEITEEFLLLEVYIPVVKGVDVAESKGPSKRRVTFTDRTKFNRLEFVPIPDTNRRKVQEIKTPLEDFEIGNYIEVISNQDITTAQTFNATSVKKLK